MPVINRQTLRQHLGQEWLRDTLVGSTSGSWGTQAGSYNIVDKELADPTASGEQMYFRQHMRLLGSAGVLQDLRIGSFNTGSGAFVGAQTLATTIASGAPFEVHSLVTPDEKDAILDRVIEKVRYQAQVNIWAVPDSHIYSLGPDIKDVIEVRYQTNPAGSLDRGEHLVPFFDWRRTGSGYELFVSQALGASQRLVLDAVLAVSLGANDLATVYIPSEDWILSGAAARALWIAEQRSPGQEAGRYAARRGEVARQYSKLSARYMPSGLARRIQLGERW